MSARRISWVMAGLIALGAAPARGEKGRVTAQLTGGVSTVATDLPQPGGAIAISLDYGAWDRVSLIVGAQGVLHRRWDTLGVGAGLKLIALQGEWARLYVLAEPAVLFAWAVTPEGHAAARTDLAIFGGVGFEYLMLWGLGFALELTGTLPVGLGEVAPGARFDPASLHLHAGFYMEL